jgi:hypothetical protein
MRGRLTAFFIVFAASANLLAQQIYPVALTGFLLPPHSLDLSVYGTLRTQDLVFNAVLNDPVEPFRDTRLKLYIENNGNTIYVSDPNAAFPTLRLDKQVPVVLDGFALQPYLQPQALTGATGQGQGSVIVPEGLNRICVEVIDIQRNVPISRKTCVTGNFFLNEPPQLLMPICHNQMPFPPTQSQLFNWTPMHIGSGNNPAPVEYVFKLVELLPGADPNDGFDFNFQVLEKTTMTPSLIYSPVDPPLFPGKTYAWRVQARNMLKPGLMFRNNGYSQVCTFSYYSNGGSNPNDPWGGGGFPGGGSPSGGGGATGLGGSTGAEQQEEIRVPPQGCEVFNTDFGPIFSDNYTPAPLVEGDVVKLGYFEMTVSDATASGEGYSGTGFVLIPMLNTKVEVAFTDLKAKPNTLRCYAAEDIHAIGEGQFFINPNNLSQATLGSNFSQQFFQNLDTYFTNGQGKTRKVSQFDVANPSPNLLPIGMDKENAPMVAITGIRFTPRNCFLTCVAYTKSPAGQITRYAGLDIAVTPFGVKNGSELTLLDAGGTSSEVADIFTLKTTGGSNSGMGMDCNGFKNYSLDAELWVSPEVIVKADDGNQLKVGLKSATSDPATYLGEVDAFDNFLLPSLPGFVFSMSSGKADLRLNQRIEPNNLGSFYPSSAQNEWRGLYLDGVGVKLPAEYDFSGNGQSLSLDQGTLCITAAPLSSGGGYGIFKKNNLINFNEGQVGSWRYSIDTMQLTIRGSRADQTTLAGRILLPILDDPYSYRANLDLTAANTTLVVKPSPGEKTMSVWNAKFNLEPASEVHAVLKDMGAQGRQFFPDADLTGLLNLDFSAQEFDQALVGNKAEIKTKLKNLFGYEQEAPDFHLQNLRLEHLKIDPLVLPEDRYTLGDYQADTLNGLVINDLTLEIGEVRLTYNPDKDGAEELGLEVVVKKGENLVQFGFYGISEGSPSGAGGGGFTFNRIEVKTEAVECKCHSYIPFGDMDPASLGMMIDKVYERFYAPGGLTHRVSSSHPVSSPAPGASGLASADSGFEKNNAELLAAYESTMKNALRENLAAGFPLLDDVLTIPFLDVQLDFAQNGSNFSAVKAIERNSANFTFPNINQNTATTGVKKLPLELTPELRTRMGMKNVELPDNARLLITAFDIAGSSNFTEQNSKVEFTLLVKIGSKYAQFVRKDVKVSPNSVDMKDFYLWLDSDVAINDPEFNGPTDKPGGITLKASKPATETALGIAETHSYAYMICDGFQTYNVQGEYAVPFKAGELPEAALKMRDRTKTKANDAESQLKFGFTINSKEDISQFIAPLKTKTADDKALEFVADGAEGLIFKPGAAPEMYLDYSLDANQDGTPDDAGAEFRGIFFKTFHLMVDGLTGENNQPLEFTVNDFLFTPADGLSGEFEKTPALDYAKGVKLGGWQYSVDSLTVSFGGEEENACHIAGKLKCPVFKDNNGVDLIAYTGDIGFTRSAQEYRPSGSFAVGEEGDGGGDSPSGAGGGEEEEENTGSLDGMVFEAEWIPGLIVQLGEGSTISFDWSLTPTAKKASGPRPT